MGIGDTIVRAMRLYLAHTNTLYAIVAIFMVPVTLAMILMFTSFVDQRFWDFDPQADPFRGLDRSEIGRFVLIVAGGGFLNFVATVLAIGASFHALAGTLGGTRPTSKSSIATELQKVGRLAWLPLLVFLLLLAGTFVIGFVIGLIAAVAEEAAVLGWLALIAAAIFFLVLWSVAIPVVMAEGRGGATALRRSAELIRGSWWRTFGIYFIVFLITLGVSLAIGAIFDRGGIESSADLTLSMLGGLVTSILVTPLYAAVLTLVYLDRAERRTVPEPEPPPDEPTATAL